MSPANHKAKLFYTVEEISATPKRLFFKIFLSIQKNMSKMARIPPFAQRILVAISAIESYIRVWMQEVFRQISAIPWLKITKKHPEPFYIRIPGTSWWENFCIITDESPLL